MTCLDNSLLQWLSKCDVWINSTSVICELVRNANFRSHPRPTELKKKKKVGKQRLELKKREVLFMHNGLPTWHSGKVK